MDIGQPFRPFFRYVCRVFVSVCDESSLLMFGPLLCHHILICILCYPISRTDVAYRVMHLQYEVPSVSRPLSPYLILDLSLCFEGALPIPFSHYLRLLSELFRIDEFSLLTRALSGFDLVMNGLRPLFQERLNCQLHWTPSSTVLEEQVDPTIAGRPTFQAPSSSLLRKA